MAIFDRILGNRNNDLEITSPYQEYQDDCLSCRVLGTWTYVLNEYNDEDLDLTMLV